MVTSKGAGLRVDEGSWAVAVAATSAAHSVIANVAGRMVMAGVSFRSTAASAAARRGFPLNQRVAHVVLVDVRDVLDGLLADFACRHHLDVAEPPVRIETARLRLAPQLPDACGSGVVRREGEEPTVDPVHRAFVVELIGDVAQVLDARLDVALGAGADPLDEHRRTLGGGGLDLHHADGAGGADAALIDPRFLVRLGRDQQPWKVVLSRVALEQ